MEEVCDRKEVGAILKNKLDLVTFHASILVSISTFQSNLVLDPLTYL